MFYVLMNKYGNAKLLLGFGAKIEAYYKGDKCAKSFGDYTEYENRYTPEYAKSLFMELLKKLSTSKIEYLYELENKSINICTNF